MKITKRISSLLTALCVAAALAPSAYAAPSVLSGAQINKIAYGINEYHLQKELYDGMQNIYVAEVDLTRDYIEVEALFSPDGVSRRSTVLNMAKNSGSFVAINADFFQTSGSDSMSATPTGTLVSDGKLLSTPSLDEGVCATAGIKNDNTVGFSYWSQNITLTAPDGASTKIHHINKFYDDGGLILITSDYSGNSIGGDYEIIVNSEGVVTDSFQNAGVLKIPDGSFVIASNTYTNTFLADHFKVGDKVKIDYEITPSDYKDYKMAVGGGTLLVKDGAPAEITHSTGIGGYNPRTAMGATADGKTLYIVTVDGRADNAKGMTLSQIADFMLNLGCHNAINFDGGGSTTYVSKTIEEAEPSVKNQLSDNYQRPVSTGVGVVVNKSAWEPISIDLRVDQNETFVGGAREFKVISTDVFYNESEIDPSLVSFSVKGIEGTWNGSVFLPTSAGNGLVTVTYGDMTAEEELLVYESPTAFEFSPSTYTGVKAGDVLNPSVYGIAPSGSRILISSDEVNWQESDGIEPTNGGIRVLNPASDSYKAYIGDMYAYIGINTSVIPSGSRFIDPLETNTLNKNTKIAVLGELGADTLYKKVFASPQIAADVNQSGADAAVLFGKSDGSKLNSAIVNGTGYDEKTVGDAHIIRIDNSGGGISATDESQWSRLENALSSAYGNNIFILLPESYYQSIGGYYDRARFDGLTERAASNGKNICVIFKNDRDSIYAQNGVHYFGVSGTAGISASNAASLKNYRYLLLGADEYGINYKLVTPLR